MTDDTDTNAPGTLWPAQVGQTLPRGAEATFKFGALAQWPIVTST